MNKNRLILLMLLFLLSAGGTMAQQVLNGTVVDEKKLPLVGASVKIKGTAGGVSTNSHGKFILEVPNANTVLQINFVGYTLLEDVAGAERSKTFQLEPSKEVSLDEVAVVGFGTQKKVSVTGSIAIASITELQQAGTPSMSNALAGRLPGLITRQSSAEPGSDQAQIFIRGLGIWVNRSPLILMDGVERDLNNINTQKVADGKSKGGAELYTVTGYLLKKFMEEGEVNIIQRRFTLKTWIYFRLGEQYLNYAEALNEAQGPVADVYKYTNPIRERSRIPNLPPGGLSKDEMRERIRHERQIELSFETHRYFDTRRWKIAEQTNNAKLYGMNISIGDSLQDDRFYQRTYIKSRVFNKTKDYLFPITQNEINKTPGLVQNPGC